MSEQSKTVQQVIHPLMMEIKRVASTRGLLPTDLFDDPKAPYDGLKISFPLQENGNYSDSDYLDLDIYWMDDDIPGKLMIQYFCDRAANIAESQELETAALFAIEAYANFILDTVEEYILQDNQMFDANQKDACPGCGCKPGEGLTKGCTHPDGCGFHKFQLIQEFAAEHGVEVTFSETPVIVGKFTK